MLQILSFCYQIRKQYVYLNGRNSITMLIKNGSILPCANVSAYFGVVCKFADVAPYSIIQIINIYQK